MSERTKGGRKTAKKTAPAIKTVKSPINGAELPVGAHPGNTGGKPGRSGRKPDEFRRHMAELVNGPDAEAYLEECLTGRHGPKVFVAAYRFAVERGYGKAVQHIEFEDKTPRDEDPKKLAAEYFEKLQRIRTVEDMEKLLTEATVAQANAKPN